MSHKLIAIRAADAPPRTKVSNYPEVFARRMAGRVKHPLGELFGLTNFGVNLVRLAPGAMSAQRHGHTRQDEFIYVLEGTPVLVTNAGEMLLAPGMCAGFKAGDGDAHHLVNRSATSGCVLGDGRSHPGDQACYPDDDLSAVQVDGVWRFTHKDGTPY